MKKSRVGAQDSYVPKEITSAFTRPDYPFRHMKSYIVTFRTDPKALGGILPPDFRPLPGYEDYVLLINNSIKCPEKLIRPYWETVIAVPSILRTKWRRHNRLLYISSLLRLYLSRK